MLNGHYVAVSTIHESQQTQNSWNKKAQAILPLEESADFNCKYGQPSLNDYAFTV